MLAVLFSLGIPHLVLLVAKGLGGGGFTWVSPCRALSFAIDISAQSFTSNVASVSVGSIDVILGCVIEHQEPHFCCRLVI